MKKISTQSYGTTITSAISPMRGLTRREQNYYILYYSGGLLRRLNAMKELSGELFAAPDSFSVDMWSLPSTLRKTSFLVSNFKFCKVVLNLFNHLKPFEVFQRFSVVPRSFVPSKLLSRKKDVYSGIRASFLKREACLDFALLWRFVLSSGFSRPVRRGLLNFSNISSYSKTTYISDMVGVYFLGAGAVTLDNHRLGFRYLGLNASTSKGSLSTPKVNRLILKDKLLCRSSFSRI